MTLPALNRRQAELLRRLFGDEQEAEALRFEACPDRVDVLGVLDELATLGLARLRQESQTVSSLTPRGAAAHKEGSPERLLLRVLQEAPIAMRDLATASGLAEEDAKPAVGKLKGLGWATIDKGALTATVEGEPAETEEEQALDALASGNEPAPEVLAGLVKRGWVESRTHTQIYAQASDDAQPWKTHFDEGSWDELVTEDIRQITPAFVDRYAGMDAEARQRMLLKPFGVQADTQPRIPGKAHPLSQMMAEIRQVFVAMGFEEIAGDYVESAFWNMDALFIPQDHPARDMQDTFYLERPAKLTVDAEALARGKAIHEHGGDTGSTGWGGSFSEEVSQRGLLRTHTTNTTVRYLANHPEGAHKVFGLGKVFRKETMDATHLPEFHQIEGIVTEPGASFDTLIGLCKVFFAAMGFPESRFRPAYFPYTEPSMEIDVKYRGKWMELGGCGIFRPEVTEPLGVEHPVLAWGFGLERLAMMRLGLKDIRELYLPDLAWLGSEPLQ